MFKLNDKVKCIKAREDSELIEGHIYTVDNLYESLDTGTLFVKLKEEPLGSYYATRFKLVTEEMSPFAEWEKAAGVNEPCIA